MFWRRRWKRPWSSSRPAWRLVKKKKNGKDVVSKSNSSNITCHVFMHYPTCINKEGILYTQKIFCVIFPWLLIHLFLKQKLPLRDPCLSNCHANQIQIPIKTWKKKHTPQPLLFTHFLSAKNLLFWHTLGEEKLCLPLKVAVKNNSLTRSWLFLPTFLSIHC